MKIVRIIARLNVGGPARHVVWLTEKLQNDEFESVLIAGTVPDGEEDMGYFAAEHGVEPIYISELSRELSPKDIISLYKIYRELRRQKPDIIHTHTAKAGTIGRIAAFMYRWISLRTLIGKPRAVKVIHTFHGHVFHSYYGKFKTRVFILIEQVLAKLATNIIVVITDQQFREIHSDFGVGSTEQFEIIPLGIELKELAGDDNSRNILRAEINASADDIVVGFVGRLTEIKDVPLLLNAVAVYANSTDHGKPLIKLAIVGDGNVRAELEGLSTELGLDEIVTFLGNRENVAEVFAGIDIVALTSKNEGTPLSLLEGMAAGKPVISTAVGGVVDILGNRGKEFDGFAVCERGISVDNAAPENFSSGLIYLAKNQKLRQDLAVGGRDFVQKRYSVDRLVKDVSTLCRNLTKT
ncbi:MAG: glycosyltransferase [Pyrinomonadaceae bacterium]|nr:glycosyltransferase [Pyrinomonadaceae bacterium]